MKDEDALELYIKLKKSFKKDRGLMRYIFDETNKIAKELQLSNQKKEGSNTNLLFSIHLVQ